MNKKATILLVALVTAILPAVAIADVMITGHFTIQSGSNTPAWYVQEGPNYAEAYNAGAIVWTPSNGPESMGELDLQGMPSGNTLMINVLDLNFSTSISNMADQVALLLNISGSTFPVGTVMAISSFYITFDNFTSTPVTPYTGTPLVFDASDPWGILLVNLSDNPSILMQNIPQPAGNPPTPPVYALSFFLPASNGWGGETAPSATLTGVFYTV